MKLKGSERCLLLWIIYKVLKAIAIVKVTLSKESMHVLYGFEGIPQKTVFELCVGGLRGTHQGPSEH